MKDFEKIVLSFDLDFTLIDNREGIINSFNFALKKHHYPLIKNEDITKMIGTPLYDMFTRVSTPNPLDLISSFREFYSSKGIYQVKLFKGVKEKLIELKNWFKLIVITSKKKEMAKKLLNNLKMKYYFDFVFGETEDLKSKTDLKLKEILFKKYPAHNFVVIGDHPNDRSLAEMLGCPFIGVLTGYHTEEQLRKDTKTKVIILNNVKEITPELIYSLFKK